MTPDTMPAGAQKIERKKTLSDLFYPKCRFQAVAHRLQRSPTFLWDIQAEGELFSFGAQQLGLYVILHLHTMELELSPEQL